MFLTSLLFSHYAKSWVGLLSCPFCLAHICSSPHFGVTICLPPTVACAAYDSRSGSEGVSDPCVSVLAVRVRGVCMPFCAHDAKRSVFNNYDSTKNSGSGGSGSCQVFSTSYGEDEGLPPHCCWHPQVQELSIRMLLLHTGRFHTLA